MIHSVVLIGAGNLATQLGSALKASGIHIAQVFSKTNDNAQKLAQKLSSVSTNQISDILTDADLYIIAVKDSAIDNVVKQMPAIANGIIVHTAGSISVQAVSTKNKFGVFYPFQTFSKNKVVDFKSIPILIEASSLEVKKELIALAEKLSEKVIDANSEQRKRVHLSAVFACNFVNHLYTISEKLLSEVNLPFDLLSSLIDETSNKVKLMRPHCAQTGPAVRNDQLILDAHLRDLSDHPEEQHIYQLLSDNILKTYRHKE